ncbi:MAG: isochorismatase family cysteine hydrolase [Clostridium sp.]|nr:isochorismatase family cysteine hydrolase [Clostridium sp.]
MSKALLIIDMQNFCVGKDSCSIFKYNNSELIKNVNQIISEYDKNDVYYIVNIMEDNEVNRYAPFKAFEGSYDADIVRDLYRVNDKVFKKYESNAFSNDLLSETLKNSGVDEIEIVGVDGGGCVARSAIEAIKLGFKVSLYTSGIGTTFTEKAEEFNKELKELGAKFK